VLLAPKLAGGYTTFSPRNVKMAENRGANLHRCGDRNRLLHSSPCHCDVLKIVSRSSVCQCPPFPVQDGGKDGHLHACVYTDRIGRTASCFDTVESCCVGSPTGDDVSCAAVAVGVGGCHFRNMTVPREGTGNRVSAGTAHVKGSVSMAGSWYLCLQQERACSMS
jgi:hypothetical protein